MRFWSRGEDATKRVAQQKDFLPVRGVWQALKGRNKWFPDQPKKDGRADNTVTESDQLEIIEGVNFTIKAR